MNLLDILSFGGELEESTYQVISYYYIPCGYKYDQAQVRYAFLPENYDAKSVVEKFAGFPDLAILMTRQEYLGIQEKIRLHKEHLENTYTFDVGYEDAAYGSSYKSDMPVAWKEGFQKFHTENLKRV